MEPAIGPEASEGEASEAAASEAIAAIGAAAAAPVTHHVPSTLAQKRRALWMVVAFTVLASVAQVLIKTGANALNGIPPGATTDLALGSLHLTVSAMVIGGLTSMALIGGLALYGIGAVMMVLALQHGELSVLYPVISLSYVWVAILSVLIFHEHMNLFRVAGIAVIIAGVAILGRSGSR